MSEMNFGCFDIILWGLKMFVCEIYRVFNGFQIFYFGKKFMLNVFKKYYYGLSLKKGLMNFQFIVILLW